MVQNPGINLLDGGPPVHEAGCVVAQAGLREDAHLDLPLSPLPS